MRTLLDSTLSQESESVPEIYAAMRIKTHLYNQIYIRSLLSLLSFMHEHELVIAVTPAGYILISSPPRVCQLQDEIIAVIALVSYTGGMACFALSYNLPILFLSSSLGFGTRMADSLLRSLVSQVGN